MPDLDPRIALMAQNPQIQPLNLPQVYLNAAQLRDIQAQGQLRQLQAAQIGMGLQQMQQIPGIYQKYMGASDLAAAGGAPASAPAVAPGGQAPLPAQGPPFASTEASLAPSGQAGPAAYPAVGGAGTPQSPGAPAGPASPGAPATTPPGQGAPAQQQVSPLDWVARRGRMYSEMAITTPLYWAQHGKSIMDVDTHTLEAQQKVLEQQIKQHQLQAEQFGAIQDAAPDIQPLLYSQAVANVARLYPNAPNPPPPVWGPVAQQFVAAQHAQVLTEQQRLEQRNKEVGQSTEALKALAEALKAQTGATAEQRMGTENFPPVMTLQGPAQGGRKFGGTPGAPSAPGTIMTDAQGNPLVTMEGARLGGEIAQQARTNLVQQNPNANNVVASLTQIHGSDTPEVRSDFTGKKAEDGKTTVNASDLALLSGYAQLIHPESARLNPSALTGPTSVGAVDDLFNRLWAKLWQGGELSSEDRQTIRQQADRLGRQYMGAFDTTRMDAGSALREHPTIKAIGSAQDREGLMRYGLPDLYSPIRQQLTPTPPATQGTTPAPAGQATAAPPSRQTVTLSRAQVTAQLDRLNAQRQAVGQPQLSYDDAVTQLRARPGVRVVE